jgi:NTE family protein
MRLGLALGGGGARGLSHIPMLEACDELGVKPAIIAGTSIGALIGAAYASGMSGADIRAYCAGMLATRRKALRHFIARWNGRLWDYWNPLTPSLLNGEKLIEAAMPPSLPRRFEELKTPLLVMTTDFHAQAPHVASAGPLIPAITASAALPALFTPVELDGRVLIDGGFVNPLPFDLLFGQADIIAAIDVSGGPEEGGSGLPGSMDVMIGSTQIALRAIINEKLKARAPDILIRPDVGRFGVLDFFRAEEVWEAAAPAKEAFKRGLSREIQNIS